MTLDTHVVIQAPTDAREVFDVCRGLLGCTDDHPWEPLDDGTGPGWRNTRGQGLPAWLFVWHGPDGSLPRDECYCEDLNGGTCGPCKRPEGFLQVSFDTAYGYRGPNGEGCGDLHAGLVDRLGTWCDQRGLPWSWKNEFTGEWHPGRDGLAELGDGGRTAFEWLASDVLPVLTGMPTISAERGSVVPGNRTPRCRIRDRSADPDLPS